MFSVRARRTSRDEFTPIQLSGLNLWLDATDYTTLTFNSGNISQWRDKSGSGRHASQGTASAQPEYLATGLGGRPTIRGDGTDSMFFSPMGNTSAMTIFMVFRQANELGANPSESAGPLGWNGLLRGMSIQMTSSTFPRVSVAFTGYLWPFNAATINAGTPTLVRLTRSQSGSIRTMAAKAFGQGSATVDDLRTTDPNNEGALFISTVGGKFCISEVLQFSKNVSAGEEAKIATYANLKYGTAT